MIILRVIKIIACFGILITNSKLIFSKDITQNDLPFKINCDNEYNVMCLKLDIVKFIEKLSEKSEFNIYPGISLLHETHPSDEKNSEIVAEIAKNYPNNTEKRLDSYLLSKLANYVHSLSLRLKLADPNAEAYPKSMETARRKPRGGLQSIIAAAMMMKGTLMTMAMGGLALLAGKALLTSLMALMLSAIVGIKSLTSGGKHTTYEIVAKPIVQTSHSHSISHEELHGGGHGGGHMSNSAAAYGYKRSYDVNLPKHLSQPN